MTIREILAVRAELSPEAPALLAPGRAVLSYEGLLRQIDSAALELRAAGIGRRDRVALVMPNGPETAAALLSVMSAAACAPLNPQYSEAEFDFYLSDLKAGAVIVARNGGSPVLAPSRRLNLKIIELSPEAGSAAGAFRLGCESAPEPGAGGPAAPGETALLLHTSGTTARPKLVALSQSNLAASALGIASGLDLKPADRCLNVMPLFHVHGMVAALLATLASGGSVVCAPGFLASEFFGWLADFAPTWYTGVPTMHHAVLARAAESRKPVRGGPLRFIRSCSASLPPSLMAGLEEAFGVPVLEAYGMTEASHQMASNPLPPRKRKPGSAGLPAGADIAVMDDGGRLLSAGETGEVVVRGPGVMAGYVDNPKANAESFAGGWFRTGDLGYLDEDGYLFLTGRKKEIINRGGEKIAPREVDEVLLDHSAVAQAVTFALPDPKLGEEVAAAVVLKPGASADAEDIRAFAANRLAHHKVPRLVAIVPEIPKGPTGKIQRIGLAEKLGLGAPRPAARAEEKASRLPMTETELRLEKLWTEALRKPLRGTADDFFLSGGESFSAVFLLELVLAEFGTTIPMSSFILNPTFEALASALSGRASVGPSRIVPIRDEGKRPPLFCVHPHDGQVLLYRSLARHMHSDQPLFAFQTSWRPEDLLKHQRPEAQAADYVEDLLAFRPAGPYYLGGYCSGAPVALEMARRLRQKGHEVALLVLMDSYAPGYPALKPGAGRTAVSMLAVLDRLRRLAAFAAYVRSVGKGRRATAMKAGVAGLADSLRSLFKAPSHGGGGSPNPLGIRGRQEPAAVPALYEGAALLLRPSREPLGFAAGNAMGWDKSIERLSVVTIRGYFRTLIYPPKIRRLAEALEAHLRMVQDSECPSGRDVGRIRR